MFFRVRGTRLRVVAAPTPVGVETQTRAKGVLSGSNHQWFNRLIKDDEPYRWTGLSVELRRSRRDLSRGCGTQTRPRFEVMSR